jgi:Phage integrase, N-terminal SAM-like domain
MARPTSRLSRVLMTGPLAPFADKYGQELKERGYTPHTTVNQLRQVARLSRWLEASGFTVTELNGERVEEFLAFQRAGGRHRASWSRPWAEGGRSRRAGSGGLADGRPVGRL